MNPTEHRSVAARLDAIPSQPPDGLILECANDVEAVPIQWLWPAWLARGKMHILAGQAGLGKTTLALSLATTVTAGGHWPDGTLCDDVGSALIWSGEDDPADTLKPRLMAMRAECQRVYFIAGMRENGERRAFDPAMDMAALAAAIASVGDVRLLIVDPIVSAVAGDDKSNNEVRRSLQPLADLASTYGVAVLGISHFTKSSQGRAPVERVTGSLAYGALVRLVMGVGEYAQPDGTKHPIVTRLKTNIGRPGDGFLYQIEEVEIQPGLRNTRIVWGDYVQGDPADLLAPPDKQSGDDHVNKVDAACEFLRELLAVSTPQKTVQQEAEDAGHAWATVRKAADKMRVVKRRSTDHWYWSLPRPAP